MRTVSLCLVAVLGLALATEARAGAWMRDEGHGFLSVSGTVRRAEDRLAIEGDVYADFGLSERLNAGISAFQELDAGAHVLAFLRFPLSKPGSERKLAIEVGLGGHRAGRRWRGMYSVTLAYGQALDWGGKAGWLGAEATVEQRIGADGPALKLDLSLGQSGGGRVRPLFKLGMTHIGARPLGWQVSANLMIEGKKHTTWVVGLEHKQAGGRSTALQLGLWRSF